MHVSYSQVPLNSVQLIKLFSLAGSHFYITFQNQVIFKIKISLGNIQEFILKVKSNAKTKQLNLYWSAEYFILAFQRLQILLHLLTTLPAAKVSGV